MMTSPPVNKEESQDIKRPLSFSIDHILNNAGKSKEEDCSERLTGGNVSMLSLPWLQCTRYCPPKVPRRKDPPQRRQLGRHPRIPFTTHQLSVLEDYFKRSPYLSSQEVKEVSRELDLADVRVKIWFQNRRARERRERSMKHSEQNQSDFHKTRMPSITNTSNHLQLPGSFSNFSIHTDQQTKTEGTNFNFISNNFPSHL